MLNLILGFIIGSVTGYLITFITMRKSMNNQIIREYEAKIRNIEKTYELNLKKLELEQQESTKKATKHSLDISRSVIKGKIAEQMAPLIPDFQYLPSDARFLGDPIDYIVFNGYTNIRDNDANVDGLEIIILDIKTGKSQLSRMQQAIEKAVEEGRIAFETVRIDIDSCSEFEASTNRNIKNNSSESLIQKKRNKYPKAYTYWTEEEERVLKQKFQEGSTIEDLSQELQRQPGGIRSRLRKLGLID
ncbi:hypothetical protein FEK30_04080 [Picosynechococcus sp. PCC 11901]|uniref:Holliday junction resolvase-like protein n=1 Tax=Picosynechococcus sp. PCC 11901 TaxID=2579791 RepID=UPI0010FC0DD1|nr:Holliday junction resolvase-like protein [Picosynechococcus sp. PCC 11901]QCS48676.1 hypothetical protein FEK30_04080 [Picosynechococcus sp. PCC 11901]